MTDLVHVKDSAMQTVPLCGFDSGTAPMAWTTRTCAENMATCAECLHEVLCDKCDCENGYIYTGCREEGCCGPSPCGACCVDTCQYMIDRRGLMGQGETK